LETFLRVCFIQYFFSPAEVIRTRTWSDLTLKVGCSSSSEPSALSAEPVASDSTSPFSSPSSPSSDSDLYSSPSSSLFSVSDDEKSSSSSSECCCVDFAGDFPSCERVDLAGEAVEAAALERDGRAAVREEVEGDFAGEEEAAAALERDGRRAAVREEVEGDFAGEVVAAAALD